MAAQCLVGLCAQRGPLGIIVVVLLILLLTSRI
jgi:hypothetical protein